MIEKLTLALVTAARHFRPYFQSHQVVVKTDYPIKQILRKPELVEWMIAWSIELSEFGINFEDFLHELGVKHLPTLVEHPQTNGQAEAANKVILRELKKRLGSAKGQWPDELPNILWAYHCTPQSTMQEMPYRLTFGADAMIPVQVSKTSHRRRTFDSEKNAQEAAVNIDLTDELREEAQIHEEACKLRASRRYKT
uniref:Transposon Ty3-I Gag-Pol polyprotein n=1 Tax=Cajanus cajan TaxID=3821 RepID=A0A151QTL6_CAJCA|nr:Transposon Ty3-I Gag-Pol polyprotein [Cajanus cajan]